MMTTSSAPASAISLKEALDSLLWCLRRCIPPLKKKRGPIESPRATPSSPRGSKSSAGHTPEGLMAAILNSANLLRVGAIELMPVRH